MTLVSKNPNPGTPEWWLLRLSANLDARNDEIGIYDAYYRGDHNLRFATPKFKEAFGATFSAFSDNWCQLIVDAPVERLTVQGFRYGEDTKGDDKAWKIWQENDMDSQSKMAFTEAGIHGTSYALVWPSEKDAASPVITIEHPSECIVEFATGSVRRRAAGLKRWLNDDGYVWATVYLPEGVYKFRSGQQYESRLTSSLEHSWYQRETAGEEWPLPNPLEVVPLVPLMNKPRLLTGGESELADVIPVQDAINKTISDMLITSEFAAAPRRYATGFKPPEDPNTGQPLPMEALINRLIVSTNKDTSFGQFPQADLSGFRDVVEMFVQHLASRTRTPPHYFYLSGSFPSGESIKSAETGLVAKVTTKQTDFDDPLEEVMRLAFTVKNDKGRSKDKSSETVWRDPESRSESEHMDAVGKMRALLHIPLETAWERAGFSVQEIERMKAQLVEEKEWLGALGLVDAAAEGTQSAAGAPAEAPGAPAPGSVMPA